MRHERKRALVGPINKILILRHGALGDVVLEVPALEAIRSRFPAAEITLLCDPYSGPILEGLPFFDKMVTTHEKMGSKLRYYYNLLKLRRERFDLVVAMRGTGRARLQAVLVGGRNRHGYASTWLGTSMFTQTGTFRSGEHQVVNMLHYLAALGIDETKLNPQLKLAISDRAREQARDLLAQSGVHGRFIVLHPTFSVRPANETWSAENFSKLIDHLTESGLQVVITSGAAQIAVVDRIVEGCSQRVVSLAGKTSPTVLAAVLEKADLYVGYNTGAMHVAAAVGTSVVAIFEQPSKYAKWRPWTDAPFRILIPSDFNEGSGQEPLYVADTITPLEVAEAVTDVLSCRNEATALAGRV